MIEQRMPFVSSFVKDVIKSRDLIIQLAITDFKKKYLGSYLGVLWGFIQPFVNIAVMWFVFDVGFKLTPVNNCPFILWLMCGMIPWFFIADSLNNATGSFIENAYLVKNIVFKISVLPIVKVLSSFYVHLFFLLFLFAIFELYGFHLDFYSIQVIYYTFTGVALVLALSMVTSTIMVFSRDIAQIVAMLLQILFWLTPIFWNSEILPDKYRLLLLFNPVNYIVQGFRDSMIYHRWFWENPVPGFLAWGTIILVAAIGTILFKRLKPHFADII